MKINSKRIVSTICIVVGIVFLLSVLLTLPLRWLNPPSTAFILRDHNVKSYSLRDRWVAFSDVSPEVFLALMASEDQRFPDHYGLDFISLKKALKENRSSVRGASTISQQLIKNLYLWPGRSLFRKGLEAWLTLCLEVFVDKKRILELYVNVVEFGSGVYGIHHAAEKFYQSHPQRITRSQASLLASVLPNPKRYQVAKPSDYILKRSEHIQQSIQALGGAGFIKRLD